METFDAIGQRRAVKAFDPHHRFTAAEETKLLEAARAVLAERRARPVRYARFIHVIESWSTVAIDTQTK
jgi:hypothetical protein